MVKYYSEKKKHIFLASNKKGFIFVSHSDSICVFFLIGTKGSFFARKWPYLIAFLHKDDFFVKIFTKILKEITSFCADWQDFLKNYSNVFLEEWPYFLIQTKTRWRNDKFFGNWLAPNDESMKNGQ